MVGLEKQTINRPRQTMQKRLKKKWNKNAIQLFVIACLGLIFVMIFNYLPMFGIIIAFKNGDYSLNILKVITDAKWVGFDNFIKFFHDRRFGDILTNTIGLNILMICINFPAPIVFALLINEAMNLRFKKVVQTLANFPHFISWIIFGGIMLSLMHMNTGLLNFILQATGIIHESINFGEAQYFWGTMIITSLLKGLGWGSIIYLAAIAGIDPALNESAVIDGANRFHRMLYITLPSIAPTITVFLLLSISGILNNSFEHFYVFQNSINLEKGEVIDTFVYKAGIMERRYSFVTAIGLFSSVVSVVLLTGSNYASKKLTGRGLF
jgi:putative aldouronate transport system permease protein